MKNEVLRAGLDDLNALVPLFDAYRQFYGLASDVELCERYLRERMQREESVIFLARSRGQAAGFSQMYPGFSSLAAQRTWTLYDLYVAPDFRRAHLANALMQAAEDFARDSGAACVLLETAISNTTAQALYERRGYQRDTEFYSYVLSI